MACHLKDFIASIIETRHVISFLNRYQLCNLLSRKGRHYFSVLTSYRVVKPWHFQKFMTYNIYGCKLRDLTFSRSINCVIVEDVRGNKLMRIALETQRRLHCITQPFSIFSVLIFSKPISTQVGFMSKTQNLPILGKLLSDRHATSRHCHASSP